MRFRHFIGESLSNFIAVDGRFLHTIKVLFVKPGLVPKNFIEGKRQRYVHPVRMYFLVSVLLLFLIEYSGRSENIVRINETETAADSVKVVTDLGEARDSILAEFSEDDSPDEGTSDEDQEGRLGTMMEYYSRTGEINADSALVNLPLENNLWNRFLYEQSVKIAEFDDKEFSRYFGSKLFWVLFLFLPILAGLHHLLYLRRKFYYPEHLFFTFYNQSVLFLMLSIGYIISFYANSGGVIMIFLLAFFVYQFLALRLFYGQKSGKTFLKFVILNMLTIPLFGIFFIIAALITFIFF